MIDFNEAISTAHHCLHKIEVLTGTTTATALAQIYWSRPPERRPDLIADLTYCAEEIPIAHDALRHIAARLLRDTMSLPADVARRVADVLEEKRQRPTRRGPDPDRDVARNLAIVNTIRYLATTRRMSPTWNITKSGASCSVAGGSACDVVGVALTERGINLGYRAVEKVWTDAKSSESPVHREACQPSYLNPQKK